MPSDEQISISKGEVTAQLENARFFVLEVEKYLKKVYPEREQAVNALESVIKAMDENRSSFQLK